MISINERMATKAIIPKAIITMVKAVRKACDLIELSATRMFSVSNDAIEQIGEALRRHHPVAPAIRAAREIAIVRRTAIGAAHQGVGSRVHGRQMGIA